MAHLCRTKQRKHVNERNEPAIRHPARGSASAQDAAVGDQCEQRFGTHGLFFPTTKLDSILFLPPAARTDYVFSGKPIVAHRFQCKVLKGALDRFSEEKL